MKKIEVFCEFFKMLKPFTYIYIKLTGYIVCMFCFLFVLYQLQSISSAHSTSTVNTVIIEIRLFCHLRHDTWHLILLCRFMMGSELQPFFIRKIYTRVILSSPVIAISEHLQYFSLCLNDIQNLNNPIVNIWSVLFTIPKQSIAVFRNQEAETIDRVVFM